MQTKYAANAANEAGLCVRCVSYIRCFTFVAFVVCLVRCIVTQLYNGATSTEVFVRGVVRRRRAFRGLKTSSKKIGRNVHAHSFRFP